MTMRLNDKEKRTIDELTMILRAANLSVARTFGALTTADLERGTRIRDWGRMARDGVGLGYGQGAFDDGRGDHGLSIEDFERINSIVNQLPVRTAAVLVHLYSVSDKPNASMTAIKLGTTRGAVEELRDQGLNIIYGAMCVRSTALGRF
jgi:hypothetical protein